MSDRLRDRLDSLGRALDRLDEALAVPADAPRLRGAYGAMVRHLGDAPG
ncbi:hypothetical protein [Rubrivirga sp.]